MTTQAPDPTSSAYLQHLIPLAKASTSDEILIIRVDEDGHSQFAFSTRPGGTLLSEAERAVDYMKKYWETEGVYARAVVS